MLYCDEELPVEYEQLNLVIGTNLTQANIFYPVMSKSGTVCQIYKNYLSENLSSSRILFWMKSHSFQISAV